MNLRSDLDTINELADLEETVSRCLRTSRETLSATQAQHEAFNQILSDRQAIGSLLAECDERLKDALGSASRAQELVDRAFHTEATIRTLSSDITKAANELGGADRLEELRQEHRAILGSLDEVRPLLAEATKRAFEARAVTELIAQQAKSIEHQVNETRTTSLRVDALAAQIAETHADLSRISRDVTSAREQVVTAIREFGGPEAFDELRSEQAELRSSLTDHRAKLDELAKVVGSSWFRRVFTRTR